MERYGTIWNEVTIILLRISPSGVFLAARINQVSKDGCGKRHLQVSKGIISVCNSFPSSNFPHQITTGPTCDNGVWQGTRVEHPEGHWKYGEKILKRLREYPERIGQVNLPTFDHPVEWPYP